MPEQTNPADRLHTIFVKAKVSVSASTAFEGWSKTFDIDLPSGRPEVLRRLLAMQETLDDLENKIRSIDAIDHDLYLRNFGHLHQAIDFSQLGQHWNNVQSLLTDATLGRLEFCSESLNKYYPENTIEQKELDDILSSIAKINKMLLNGSLPRELKEVIHNQLETIRRAVAEYQIRGAEGLRKAFATGMGEIAVFSRDADWKPEVAPGLNDKVWSLLSKVDTVSSLALKGEKYAIPFMRDFMDKLPQG